MKKLLILASFALASFLDFSDSKKIESSLSKTKSELDSTKYSPRRRYYPLYNPRRRYYPRYYPIYYPSYYPRRRYHRYYPRRRYSHKYYPRRKYSQRG